MKLVMSRLHAALFVITACIVGLAAGVTQENLEYFADHVSVRVRVDSNLETTNTQFTITLHNDGTQSIPLQDWELHLCFIRLLFPDALPFEEPSAVIPDTGLRVSHVAGCLYKLFPDETFQGLPPHSSLQLNMVCADWMSTRTDFMPNWYIIDSANTLTPAVVRSTESETLDFVEDFTTADQWKRDPADLYDPYTNEERHAMYGGESDDDLDLSVLHHKVIPTVLHSELDVESRVHIDDQWAVRDASAGGSMEFEAQYLADALGLDVETEDRDHLIDLVLEDDLPDHPGGCLDNLDLYEVIVTDTKVTITGTTTDGVFYGAQTVKALLHLDNEIPRGSVHDCPRYEYRGMHIDVGRNFLPVSTVMQLMDVMADYKLNKLHFHLTEDEAWRLQIRALPELTEVGATKCHDPESQTCINPQLGSSPHPGQLGSGYYTTQQYRDLLRYANERHIQVIPEIDMPGHAHAPIMAMEARYHRLMEEGDAEAALQYLLSDLEDQSQYISAQLFTDNAINPCISSTYSFIDEVIQELIFLHEGIQPLTMFHFGGDEVPMNAWVDSPKCREWLDEANIPPEEERNAIKRHFIISVSDISASYGLALYGWEDGFLHNEEDSTTPYDLDDLANNRALTHAWNNVWEWGSGQRAYVFANSGYQVVLAHATHLYFDHPIEPDPEERGYYWATRWSNAKKTFSFNANDIYANIDVDRMGNSLTREGVCGEDGAGCPALENPENIVGIQGHLWSETCRTTEQFQSMVYPRMLAMAERAWHQASWETSLSQEEEAADWRDFRTVVGMRELHRLQAHGIRYRLQPAGVVAENEDTLHINTEFPGLNVTISEDDGQTWDPATPGVNMVQSDKTYTVAVVSSDGSRYSRAVQISTVPPSSGTTATRHASLHSITAAAVAAASTMLSMVLLRWI